MSEEKTDVYFDESIPAFVGIIAPILGKKRIASGWILRDASGRLAFIADEPLSQKKVVEVTQSLSLHMPAYCRNGRTILDINQPGVSSVLERARESIENIVLGGTVLSIRLIEQRIVGQDWLTSPAQGWSPPDPARFVFASLKGGVGRSTSLVVVAADLAAAGRKVLVVDLDLEAPGIGSMLLTQEEMPRFGILDWYVESGLRDLGREFLLDMVAPSAFGKGRGLVDVVPATGVTSQNHPANVLAKISRAYLEVPGKGAEPSSFLMQTQSLINELATLKQYDVILIDARAGLNETTAAAVLGLGADVLLFGENTPQTFAGYRFLLSHLARFSRDETNDWLYRIRMIHAKALKDESQQEAFRDSAHQIFMEFLYKDETIPDRDGNPELDSDGKPITIPEVSLDDPDAPHYAWPVLLDSNFLAFNPMKEPSLLTTAAYESSYKNLIAGISERLETELGD